MRLHCTHSNPPQNALCRRRLRSGAVLEWLLCARWKKSAGKIPCHRLIENSLFGKKWPFVFTNMRPYFPPFFSTKHFFLTYYQSVNGYFVRYKATQKKIGATHNKSLPQLPSLRQINSHSTWFLLLWYYKNWGLL